MNNIVLFEPEIPGNTGNIMRTCVATNTKLHLIKPLGFSLDDIYYYFTRYGKKPHTSFNYKNEENKELYFIFGKESTGIPKEILQKDLEHCMRIPMTKNVRALNLSNAAAIVIYEALRQQNYNDLLRTEPHKGEDYLEK